MLDAIVSFVQSNPLLVFAVLFFLYNKWQASQPWPDYGGRITSVHSVSEWDALLADSKGKVVIVDAYATWCPPCKAAAPVYARMSETFDPAGCTFAKFNTDEAKDLARKLGITAMPTFLIFKDGTQVEAVRGFAGEAGLRSKLEAAGAVSVKKD